MKTSRLLGLVLLVLVTRSTVAQGQTQPLSCFTDPPCKALSERAKQQSASGNLAEAFRLYKLAYGVRPDPALLFNLARVLHKQGQEAEAVPYYRQFIESPQADSEQQAKAREYLQQAEAAALAKEPPPSPEAPHSGTAEPAPVAPPGGASLPLVPDSTRDRHAADKPLVKKWWLWVAVGGGLLAAGAVTAGVVLATSSSAPDRGLPSHTLMFMF